MPCLALSLLGTFQASAGKQPITNFATDKVRALLAYLAVEADRPHRRDTLAALLWPDWDDSGARSNLRLALHRLRETLDTAEPALSDGLFGVTRETVQINSAALDVDVARFTALVETCEMHPHRLLHLCPSCLEQLAEAAALYSGELLAGLSIEDAPGFEQWELVRREELGQRVLALLYRLADAFEQLGDYGRGLLFAHRQLALDPYREEAHRQAIRFYALQGERAAALAHFDRARRLLAEELGVEPDPATLQLIEEVRAGKLAGTNRASANGHGGRPLLHHFPARFTPFFGRESEIARLVERLTGLEAKEEIRRLEDWRLGDSEIENTSPEAARPISNLQSPPPPPPRLLTIIAPGGMGKTRLAIAAAEALAERPGYPDGIYFLSLARVASTDLLPSALAAVLNVNLGGAADPVDQLAAFLRPKSMLLLLDNFEHLLDGADLLLRLLEEAPGLRLLVTSREALAVRPEERFVLGGLEDEAAERLFTGAATRVRPGYEPGPADREAIRAIGRDVGGMPLALELAATWVRLMDAPAIAARIRADLDFLSTNLRDLPQRQRSMRAVFDYMWETLSPPERAALAALSVLRGPFRLDAAEAIAGASPDVLALLLDQSLLRASGGGRFELHEMLRQYAGGKLAAESEREATAGERHAGHYLALLANHGAALGRAGSKEALAALLRNLDNIRAAWGWVVAEARLDAIARAAPSLKTLYRFSGLLLEGAEAFAAAAAEIEARIADGRLAPETAYPAVYDLVETEAMMLDVSGRMSAALERLEKARAGWETLGDRRRLCHVLSDMGQVNVRMTRMVEANRWLDPALAMARELGDDSLTAFVLHNKGSAAAWSGDPAGGQAFLDESIAYYRAAGDQKELAGALCDLGTVHAFKHDMDIARVLLRQSLSIAESIGDDMGALLARTNLGSVSLDAGELAAAEEYSRAALTLAQDLSEQQLLCVALGNLGHVALADGNRHAALRIYMDSMTMTQAIGLDYMLSETLLGLASLAVTGEPAAAARWLAAVKGWRQQMGYTSEQIFLMRLRTETEAGLRAELGDAAYEIRRTEGLALSLEAAAGEAAAWAVGEM